MFTGFQRLPLLTCAGSLTEPKRICKDKWPHPVLDEGGNVAGKVLAKIPRNSRYKSILLFFLTLSLCLESDYFFPLTLLVPGAGGHLLLPGPRRQWSSWPPCFKSCPLQSVRHRGKGLLSANLAPCEQPALVLSVCLIAVPGITRQTQGHWMSPVLSAWSVCPRGPQLALSSFRSLLHCLLLRDACPEPLNKEYTIPL